MATCSASVTPASPGSSAELSTSRRISKRSRTKPDELPSIDLRRTVARIAQELTDKEMKIIRYIYCKELGEVKDSEIALSVFEKLQKKGVFSARNIDPLVELLRECGRDDLANEIFEQYHEKGASCQVAVTTTSFPETSTGEGAGFTSGITTYISGNSCEVQAWTLNSENKTHKILVGGGNGDALRGILCHKHSKFNYSAKKHGLALKLEQV